MNASTKTPNASTPIPQVASTPTPRNPSTIPPRRCWVDTGILGGTVNVRSGPGMNFSVVWIANEGEELEITGEPIEGWIPVRRGNLIGYFYSPRWCKYG